MITFKISGESKVNTQMGLDEDSISHIVYLMVVNIFREERGKGLLHNVLHRVYYTPVQFKEWGKLMTVRFGGVREQNALPFMLFSNIPGLNKIQVTILCLALVAMIGLVHR